MELKVWVEGIQRIVCGVTDKTTCQVRHKMFFFYYLNFPAKIFLGKKKMMGGIICSTHNFFKEREGLEIQFPM